MNKKTRQRKYYTIRKKHLKGGTKTDSLAKTIKHKRKYKLKIVDVFGDVKKDIKIPQETIKIENKMGERWNEKFIDVLEKLNEIMMKQGEPFRARAYKKAQETIMSYPEDITSVQQISSLPGIGVTITEKLKEYVETGTLKVLEREKNNPVNILADVYGIGPKKAKELVEKGITSITELREKQDELLNDTQKIGLKYYEQILERIPRDEIDEYQTKLSSLFAGKKITFEIVGSYRRGAKTSGDIDIIVTSNEPTVFKTFIDQLIQEKIIIEVLSRGKSKCLVIAQLPGYSARRVDFLFTTPEEYPFAVLYFTGSKAFNTVMRGHALKMGLSLNEHGLEPKEKVGNTVFPDEKSIFDYLNLVYKEPAERTDGRAVVVKASLPVEKGSSLPPPLESVVLKPAKVVKKPSGLSKTIKKKVQPVDSHLELESAMKNAEEFKKNGMIFLQTLGETELGALVRESDKLFHSNGVPFLSDNEYDIVKEYLENRFPSNPILGEIGTPVGKNKVVLPFEMASMDKIKPDTSILDSWKQKYTGPYLLSCKLDGVSGMYSCMGGERKLYTRGNGKIGQDISNLIEHLKLPPLENTVVRGEFVIPKSVFASKYSNKFANARNLVAGIVNRLTVDEKIRDVHFVVYEVIQPELKPSAQMAVLANAGLEVVFHKTVSSGELTNNFLSETLLDWRKNYLYDIDGVIVADDKIHPRKSGNPEHAFAFKMVLGDQVAEAKVVDVLWTPSKDGYLKPRVQIEPIHLGGVKIEYATGFNAAFIEANKIGVGALIQLVRSGDVIPHIRSVVVPAEKPKMPMVAYKWNDTHVDILLEDIESDLTVLEKNIAGFFKGLEVDGLSSGNVSRLVGAGYDSVPKILAMKEADFLKVPGFKAAMASKLYNGIQEKVAGASLTKIMSASNVFGRGFSDSKIEMILREYPDVLVERDSKKLAGVKGMASKTAEAFISKIPAFLKFLEDCGLSSKLVSLSSSKEKVNAVAVDESHPLFGKSIVMTGFRDKKIIEELPKFGAKLGSSVSKNTFVVVVKDKDETTGKVAEAKKLGVPIMTPEEFAGKYML